MSFRNQPTKVMAPQELEEHVKQFLSENNMCVLATCYDNMPRATPIEYHCKGITLYFAGEPGMKIKNLANNQNVSVGIYLPYTGWDSAKGAQITGKATILPRNTEKFKEGLEDYQWEKTAKQFNLQDFPQQLSLMRIDPSKIELIDMSLSKKGYSPRQVLTIEEKKGE